MNPLDWTAGPFLELYIAVAVAAWAFASFLRRWIGTSVGHVPPLAPPELAYLAGGEQRVGDAVIVGLLTANAATLSQDGRTIDVDGAKIGTSPDMAPFARFGLSGAMKRQDFQRRLRPVMDATRDKLERLGLRPDSSELMAYRLKALALFAIPLLLGIAKVQVGLERHKPVGYSTTLLVITVVIALLHLIAPRLTRAGREALAAEKKRLRRRRRATRGQRERLSIAS